MPPPPPSREEVEVRKLDVWLALTDARIQIVTPIPGQQKAGGAVKAGGRAEGGSEEAGADEDAGASAV